jgi:hypothetical protein
MNTPNTITKEIISISPVIRHQHEEQGATILHCHIKSPERLQICKSTYLRQNTGGDKSLIHAEGIAVEPEWTVVKNRNYVFTLVFEALDKECTSFEMIEDEPLNNPFESNFYVEPTPRNKTDVYNVQIVCWK